MIFPFEGPRLKLGRAHEHLVNIKAIEVAYFNRNRPAIVIEDDPELGCKVAKARIVEPVPEAYHVFAGELIYQMRSSLDQLAVAAARLSEAKPNVKDIYFPSGDSPKGFEASCGKNLAGFDDDFRNMIVGTDCYNGANERLKAVFSMANVDKHFNMLASASSGEVCGIRGFTFRDAPIYLTPGERRPLQEGVVFARVLDGGDVFPNTPDAQITVRGSICLSGVAAFEGRPFGRFLQEMLDETSRVYRLFVDVLQNRS